MIRPIDRVAGRGVFGGRRVRRGFTLVELLVVVAIIATLLGILLPGLSQARALARSLVCQTNERTLMQAVQIYTNEHRGFYPPRTGEGRWPTRLRPTYGDLELLICPEHEPPANDSGGLPEADAAPRSYLINGFNDFALVKLGVEGFKEYEDEEIELSVKDTHIRYASETIVFGELVEGDFSFYMDIFEGNTGNLVNLEQSRHATGRSGMGWSNYAFADGSVRNLHFGEAFVPVNRWALSSEYRRQAAGDPDPEEED